MLELPLGWLYNSDPWPAHSLLVRRSVMSLQPQAVYLVPAETARVAHAIFPTPNPIMRMYDEFGVIFNDADFADLFPRRGQPAEAPVRLALAALLQFMEGLTDRQAADAVRSLFDTLLTLAQDRGLLKAGGRQRSDSTHVLGAARSLTRLECVTETLRHALNELAPAAPQWLQSQTTAEWVARYGGRASEYRFPKGEAKRLLWAEQVGRDGWTLLEAVYAAAAPAALREVAAVP